MSQIFKHLKPHFSKCIGPALVKLLGGPALVISSQFEQCELKMNISRNIKLLPTSSEFFNRTGLWTLLL